MDDREEADDDGPPSPSALRGIRDAWIAAGAMALALAIYFVLIYLGVR